MSEHDSGGGSSRKGFMRDMIDRIAPAGTRADEEGEAIPGSELDRERAREGASEETRGQAREDIRDERGPVSEVERLQDAIRFFGSDSVE